MSATSSRPRAEASLDPWKVIYLLRDNIYLLALCALLGVTAAILHIKRTPPVYSSQAVLEVAEDKHAYVDFEKREEFDLNSAALLKTIEQTIAGQAVLRSIIASQNLAEDPTFAPPRPQGYTEAELLGLLQQRISVSLIRGTRLIAVSAWDYDPERAQKLALGVIDGFFTRKLAARREDTNSARAFLTSEAKRLEREVHAAEERLQAYQEKHKAVSLTDRHNLVLQRLSDLGKQMTEARAHCLSLETDRQQVQTLLEVGPRELLNFHAIASLPEIVELRKQLNFQTAEVATLSQRYRDKHPSMIQARRQLSEIENTLDMALSNAAEGILQSYRTAAANEEAVKRELADQEGLAMELSRLAISYRALEREANSTNVLYQQVLARLKTSDITHSLVEASDLGGRINVIAEPMVPVYPSGISSKIFLLLGLAGGGGLGVAIVIARRALDTSILSVDDAEAFLGVPSLAAIPRSSLRESPGEFVIQSHPATIEAESFRSLRTSLSLLFPDDQHRVVMFTSAVPGEGKSYCSANYAAAVAQQGARTLLIDADLRRSGLRARFAKGGVGGPGLTECLRDPLLIADAIQPTVIGNLFVLGDMRGSTMGGDILAGGNFKRLLDVLLRAYDRIIIDTAPVTAVGDTLCLAPYASAVCMVVHAGYTPRRVVRRACVILGKPPAGVVLNQIRPGRSASYYYYSNGDAYVRDAAPAPASG